jgi:hypothetical protein
MMMMVMMMMMMTGVLSRWNGYWFQAAFDRSDADTQPETTNDSESVHKNVKHDFDIANVPIVQAVTKLQVCAPRRVTPYGAKQSVHAGLLDNKNGSVFCALDWCSEQLSRTFNCTCTAGDADTGRNCRSDIDWSLALADVDAHTASRAARIANESLAAAWSAH